MHFLQRGCVSSHLIRRALLRAVRTGGNVSGPRSAAKGAGLLAPTGRFGTLCEPWVPIAFAATHRLLDGGSS